MDAWVPMRPMLPLRWPGRGAGRWGHHSQNRDGVLRRQHVQRGGGHGAAGDDDSLEIEGAQEGHVLPRVFHNVSRERLP